jgi:hypothetical protein|tara:strand:+ start:1287 stop:1562 length:276 start_codon:yes stop_codon:yes gene_type:complete
MPKDACYRKVKASYSVFPSAYASGAIAKCRKVGAANYGKSKKKKSKVRKASTGGYGKTIARQVAKRPSNNKNVARGCGLVMEDRRKETQYS